MGQEKDITGQVFGKLTAVGRASSNNVSLWVFRCECGKEKIINKYNVTRGTTNGCGCIRGRKEDDITGKTFAFLTAIKRVGSSNAKGQEPIWLFRCICGTEKQIRKHDVTKRRTRRTKSCGCKTKEFHKGRAAPNRLPDGEGAKRQLFLSYKKAARNRGYEFLLTLEQFEVLTKLTCHYCGREPYNTTKVKHISNGQYIYNGIDRLNNKEGYIIDNCVSCCKICNIAKRDIPYEEFIKWLEQIVKFRKGFENE